MASTPGRVEAIAVTLTADLARNPRDGRPGVAVTFHRSRARAAAVAGPLGHGPATGSESESQYRSPSVAARPQQNHATIVPAGGVAAGP